MPGNPYPRPDRAAREAELLAAVERTRQECETAKQEYNRLKDLPRDLDLSHPNGAARQNAMKMHEDARVRHVAALKALADFILRR